MVEQIQQAQMPAKAQPSAQPQPGVQAIAEPGKSKKWLWITILIVILAGVGAYFWLM